MPPATPLLSLPDLGWDDGWADALAAGADPSGIPGRVSRVDRGVSTVVTATGPVRVTAVAGLALAVGDWVSLGSQPLSPRPWTLTGILPRRCAFRRVGDGPGDRAQVVAANIDSVFLVAAVGGRLSVRHLERYVALALQSGALPVIVVTKSDLASPEQLGQQLAVVAEAVAGVSRVGSHEAGTGVAVHVVSAATGDGVGALSRYLGPGRTVAVLGLSGAGKSTLVNLLAGEEVLATGTVRADGKGRHTTTHRELIAIPGGGLVIDTPGMRALSVVAAEQGTAELFADIEGLERDCGFLDCSHTSEPGCAVRAAVAAGQLSVDRVASWRHLRLNAPPEDPQTARHRIVEQKRQKAVAKASRSRSRSARRCQTAPPQT